MPCFINITPLNNADNNFSLSFVAPFYQSGDSTTFILSSTAFKINNVDHFFGDLEIPDSENRTIMIYKIVNNENIIVNGNVGLIAAEIGVVTLNDFGPDDTTPITITLSPNSLDIAPKRNQIINVDSSKIIAKGSIDNIAYSGSSGTLEYSTTSRMR